MSRVLVRQEVAPDVLRGISLPTLMICACAVLRCSDDQAEDWYSRSKPIDTFAYFLSHSWRDGRFSKALGLTLHISRRSAIWVSCLVVAAVACFQFFDVVPLPSYSFKLMDGQLSTNGVSCLILGCIVWCLHLALAPYFQSSEMWFLDKACICQTNPELKRKGIRALRTFLERSSAMVILLTPNYFSRGWCTFEIAAFMASRGIHAVEIVPLSRSALVMCAFGITVFASAAFHISVFFGLTDVVGEILGQPTIFGFEVAFLLVFCAPPGLVFGIAYIIVEHYVAEKQVIVDQVRNFSMEKAEFADENDRAFVTEVIESLFGTVSSFEVEVHTAVYKKIEKQLGADRWQCVPFDAIVLGALPCFWLNVDMFCTDPEEMKILDFLNGTIMTFAFLPLLFAMFGVWAKVKLKLTRGTAVWLQHLASAVASAFACSAGVVGMSLILGVFLYAPWHLALIVWVFWIVVTAATFAEFPCSMWRSGNGGSPEEEAEAPMLKPLPSF